MTTVITREQGYAGFSPEIVRIVTTATLSQVTTAGWYNNSPIAGESLANVDIVLICYNYASSTQATAFFSVAISAKGVVTFSLAESSVVLPVVSGHFANFSGTSGAITDDGYLPSNAALTNVVMQSAASVIGDVPKYNDVNGTLVDSGIAASNIMSLAAVNTMTGASSIVAVKANGTEAANAVTASGMAGKITTSSLTTAGGANYAITWTNTFIAATNVVLLTIAGGTNTTENITLKVIPGAGSATLTIYNNTAATALNGTIIISYLVM